MDIKRIKLYTADLFNMVPYIITSDKVGEYYQTTIEPTEVFNCNISPCSIIHHVILKTEITEFLLPYIPVLFKSNYVIYIKSYNKAINKIKKSNLIAKYKDLPDNHIRLSPTILTENNIGYEMIQNNNTGYIYVNIYDNEGEIILTEDIAIPIHDDVINKYKQLANCDINNSISTPILNTQVLSEQDISIIPLTKHLNCIFRTGYSTIKLFSYCKKVKQLDNHILNVVYNCDNIINNFYIYYKDNNISVRSIRPTNKLLKYK